MRPARGSGNLTQGSHGAGMRMRFGYSRNRPGRTSGAGLITLASLLGGIVMLAGCATPGPQAVTEATLSERIAQARTMEDHTALAMYYDEQAAAAQRRSEEYRKLRKRYERTPQSLYYPLGMAPALLAHYDELIANQVRNAEAYRQLAALHREQAAGVPGDRTGVK